MPQPCPIDGFTLILLRLYKTNCENNGKLNTENDLIYSGSKYSNLKFIFMIYLVLDMLPLAQRPD